MDRTDLYGECNVENAPVDVFTAECCVFCINPKCSRSTFGKSKFEIRTSTWYERLFTDTPRMDPGDSNYSKIAAQKFVNIKPSLGDINPDWVDPLILDLPPSVETSQAPVSETFPDAVSKLRSLKTKDESQTPEPEKPSTPEPVPVPEPTPEPPKTPKPEPKGQLPNNLALENTPVEQGQMIKPQKEIPQGDSWDAPISSADTENVRVVKPGTKIKLG